MAVIKTAKFFLFVVGLLGLFVYTMAFPGTLSWFILLFYCLVTVAVWLSSRVLWRKITVIERNIHLLAAWPLLFPMLTIRVDKMEQLVPAFLRKRFDLKVNLPRGHYDKLWVQTSGEDFFGFFRHQSTRHIAVDLDVYPEIVPLYKLSHHPEIRRYLTIHAPEVRQIRDYMFQDPMKHVDWKASFRRNKLMVKEYEKEIEPRLHLIFIGYQSPGFEELLAVAYSAMQEWQKQVEVRMDLIGGGSFLTIQPHSEKGALLTKWQSVELKYGKAIVFAPEDLVEDLRMSRHESFLIVTEAGEAQ